MKDFVARQLGEVEKAIVGGGKYEICKPYKSMETTDGKWWRMSEEQRKIHLQKFHSCTISLPAADAACTINKKGKAKAKAAALQLQEIELTVSA